MSIVNALHTLTPKELEPRLILAMQAGWVPFIHGSPGIGKSAVVRAVARKFNLKLIDHRMSTADSTDLSGLPRNTGTHAEYVPFEEFPIRGQALPEEDGHQYAGWLLFLDELNSARKEVQAACYKLILDRMVGQKNLHENVFIVAAGNLASDRAIVNQLSTATRSRLIHFVCAVNEKEFYQDIVLGHQYNYRVAGYLAAYPDMTYVFDPNSEEVTFPSPRTWQMVSDIWNTVDADPQQFEGYLNKHENFEDWMAPSNAGCLGSTVGEAFSQFCRIYQNLPSYENVLREPERTPVPSTSDVRFAMVTMLFMQVTLRDLKTLAKYVRRFPDIEFEMMFYRQVLTRNPEWRHESAVQDILVRLADLESQ